MKLILKFNLAFLVVFLIGLAVSGYAARDLLQSNAEHEVLDTAGLLIQKAEAVRNYTAQQVAPLLQTQMKYTFLPQSVPSFAAIEVLKGLTQKFPEYTYKAAMLNPTNPRDRASDWEADLVQNFRNRPDSKEITGQRDTPTGRSLYVAHPIRIETAACLPCHSTPGVAPPSMIKVYGNANGFGWKLNEVVGAQVVSVPMSVPLENANQAFRTFMVSLAGVFGAVFLVLNLMLSSLIIGPVSRMSAAADKISTGDFDQPEFPEEGKDEVAVLANAFNRMRRSLEKAMQMIDS